MEIKRELKVNGTIRFSVPLIDTVNRPSFKAGLTSGFVDGNLYWYDSTNITWVTVALTLDGEIASEGAYTFSYAHIYNAADMDLTQPFFVTIKPTVGNEGMFDKQAIEIIDIETTGGAQESTLNTVDSKLDTAIQYIGDYSGGGDIKTDIAGIVDNTDWSETERRQIRDALGVDGIKTTAVGGKLQDTALETTVTDYNNYKADVSLLALDSTVAKEATLDTVGLEVSEINTKIGTPIGTDISTDINNVLTAVGAVQTSIDDPVNGLSAINTAVGNVSAEVLSEAIDTLDLRESVKRILSYATGNIQKVGASYLYKAQDNVATTFTLSRVGDDRIRS